MIQSFCLTKHFTNIFEHDVAEFNEIIMLCPATTSQMCDYEYIFPVLILYKITTKIVLKVSIMTIVLYDTITFELVCICES
jgi:uncharacterized membrane protein YesL